MPPKVGDLVSGKYRLVRVIGDGGMGTVFEAKHEYLGTQVALKFLHAELAEREGLVARFLQEAQLAATLKSPYVAHVTDVDQTTDGTAYLVMELLHGQSLQAILEREKKLPTDRALDYTVQILAGLDAAHAINVVHRDLKPDNVFVVDTAHGPLVKLLDFGIAKLRNPKEWQAGLTRPGSMMGTPEYMAPEQAYSADTVDARADVYAVGTMLYEMLLGRRPALGENAQQIAAFVMSGQVPNLHRVDPSLPEGLARVVHRAMSPMPNDRFASVAELRQALLPFCRALSVAGRFAATPPAAGAGIAPPAGVAPTLPPDDRSPSGPTTEPGTPAPPYGPPYPRPAAPAGPQMPPYAQPSPNYAQPNPAYPSHPRSHDGTPSPGRQKHGRRGSMWLLVGTIGLAIAVVAVILVTARTSPDDPASSANPTSIGAAPTSAPSAATPPAAPAAPQGPVVIAPPIQPANAPAAAHPPPAPAKPRAADAGVIEAGATRAPVPPPAFPFPIPSGLPLPFPSGIPIPSAFPLPSGFPPFLLPGFPLPPSQAAPQPAPSH
jgi:serine/threonine protein kinase